MSRSDDTRPVEEAVGLPNAYQPPLKADRASFQELLVQVGGIDRVIGLQVIARLAEMGAMAAPYLLDALKAPDPALRQAAAEALRRTYQGDDLQALIVAHLVRTLDDDSSSAVRWAVSLTLGWIGERLPVLQPVIIPALAARLSDQAQPFFNQMRVADAAADALERIGTEAAHAALGAQLGS